jgi:uncharacterized membrane protein
MNKRKIKQWSPVVMLVLFLISAIQAWFDPTDNSTHLRAYIYSFGIVISTIILILSIRHKT